MVARKIDSNLFGIRIRNEIYQKIFDKYLEFWRLFSVSFLSGSKFCFFGKYHHDLTLGYIIV